jgi:hypothetical protein
VVEYFAPYSRFGFFIFDEPVFQSATEACFHAEHGGLGTRAAVVADASFPAIFANPTDRFITRQRRPFAVAVMLDLRILTRRNPLCDAWCSSVSRTFHGSYAPSP